MKNIKIKNDPRGRYAYIMWEHIQKHFKEKPFRYSDLPEVDADLINYIKKQTEKIGPRVSVISSVEKLAKSEVLTPLKDIGLIETVAIETFSLTEAGKVTFLELGNVENSSKPMSSEKSEPTKTFPQIKPISIKPPRYKKKSSLWTAGIHKKNEKFKMLSTQTLTYCYIGFLLISFLFSYTSKLEPVEAISITRGADTTLANDRVFRLWSENNGFGDYVLPETIKAKASKKTLKYFKARNKTTEIQSNDGLTLFYVQKLKTLRVIICVILFLLLCFIMEWEKTKPWSFMKALVIWVSIFIFQVVIAFSSGTELVIDNATEHTVIVQVNGRKAQEIPANSFLRNFIYHYKLKIRTKSYNGESIEAIDANIEKNIYHLFIRYFLGLRGSLIYNVKGINAYDFSEITYFKR